jgi:hypothetical protein
MSEAGELLEKARTNRDLASRARRLARHVSMDDDRARLVAYADELEELAHQLGKQAAALAPISTSLSVGLETPSKASEKQPAQPADAPEEKPKNGK